MASPPVLVTGAAGFIGFHVSKNLVEAGQNVFGIDNLNDYYDPALKQARLDQLADSPNFTFQRLDIEERDAVRRLFEAERPTRIIHLAAQAGVRYSIENPEAYVRTNVLGFLHILEACRAHAVEHLVAASSSSVYGSNALQPLAEEHNVDHPVSLYAATKKSDELMGHVYAHLYRIPVSFLRFFTVYGPWGRPDMAYFSFTKAILEGNPIKVFNEGRLKRDFTYIDDIVSGILGVLAKPPTANPNWEPKTPDPATSTAPYQVLNIGNHEPVELMRFIELLEEAIGVQAVKEFLPMQPGDVLETFASVDRLRSLTGFSPSTPLDRGLERFVQWYRNYYGC